MVKKEEEYTLGVMKFSLRITLHPEKHPFWIKKCKDAF